MFAEVTHSELEPKCDMLKFPAHLKWARHKADIRETEAVDRWFDRLSSTSMRRNCIQNPSQEQDKMVSYRIATVLKLPDEHAVRKGMLELFQL